MYQPVGITAGASSFYVEPANTLDPRIFVGHRMNPRVRSELLGMVKGFLSARYMGVDQWLRVWLAGSGASYRWHASQGLHDLDILLGIDFIAFRLANRDFSSMGDKEIAKHLNDEMREQLWAKGWHDDYEVTFYVFVGGSVRSNSGLNSYSWEQRRGPRIESNESSLTTEQGSPSPISSNGTASTSSNFSTSESRRGNPSARTGDSSNTRSHRVDAPPFARAAVNNRQFAAESASPASRSTRGSGTTSASTASTSPSTRGFWQSKVGSALSAGQQSPEDRAQTSSKSTTATTPEGFGDSSATGATLPSARSETRPKPLSVSSGTSGVDNATSWDIRSIHPYAAYDLIQDGWTVAPSKDAPVVPTEYEVAVGLYHQRAQEAVARYTASLAELQGATSAPSRASAERKFNLAVGTAADLFDQIHQMRRASFADDGGGYADWGNFLWQSGKQHGWLPALRQIKEYADDMRKNIERQTYGLELPDPDILLRRAALAYRSTS